MFERYTERARQVVVLAQAEARETKSEEITTLHVLIALLREDHGLAAQILKGFHFDVDRLRSQVKEGEGEIEGSIPFSPEAKKALGDLALSEALSLGHNYIGTEHILLGLLRADEWLGGDLEQWGVTREAIVRSIKRPETAKPVVVPAAEAREESMNLRDTLDDVLNGLRLWKRQKIASADLDDYDESLIRWIEGGPAGGRL